MQKGFTLVELMIVIAIVGILVTIAVPQFRGYTERANDKKAQSDLVNLFHMAGMYIVK